MAHDPSPDDGRQYVALIQQMWLELQAARRDPMRHENLAERIRQERERLRREEYPDPPES